MNSDLRSYETFYWVAKLGSFSRAAERLHTTQPAVSQRVATLERQLGMPLLDRTGRKTTATQKGRELCEHMERLLHLIEDMRKAAAGPTSRRGYARLGVDETLAHTWLGRFIERVQRSHPRLALDVRTDTSPRIADALADGQVDLAFVNGPLSDLSAVSYRLCSYPLAFIASPEFCKGAGWQDPNLDAIARQPLITYPRGTSAYLALNDLIRSSTLPRPVVHGISSTSLMVRMIRDRLGVGFITPAVVASELESGDLTLLQTNVRLPDLNFSAALQPESDRGFLEPIVRLAQVATYMHERNPGDRFSLSGRITIDDFKS